MSEQALENANFQWSRKGRKVSKLRNAQYGILSTNSQARKILSEKTRNMSSDMLLGKILQLKETVKETKQS